MHIGAVARRCLKCCQTNKSKVESGDIVLMRFRSSGEYVLTESPETCYCHKAGQSVATFDQMEVQGNTLTIHHFAVHYSKRKDSLGEDCARAFAKCVSEQKPRIESIEFKLSKATEGTRHDKANLILLKDSRMALLDALGIENRRCTYVPAEETGKGEPHGRYVVEGTWPKAMWENRPE